MFRLVPPFLALRPSFGKKEANAIAEEKAKAAKQGEVNRAKKAAGDLKRAQARNSTTKCGSRQAWPDDDPA